MLLVIFRPIVQDFSWEFSPSHSSLFLKSTSSRTCYKNIYKRDLKLVTSVSLLNVKFGIPIHGGDGSSLFFIPGEHERVFNALRSFAKTPNLHRWPLYRLRKDLIEKLCLHFHSSLFIFFLFRYSQSSHPRDSLLPLFWRWGSISPVFWQLLQ